MRFTISSLIVLLIVSVAAKGQISSPGDEPIGSFYVVAIDSIDVPGKEPGALTELMVEEGALVELDNSLAKSTTKSR